MFTLRIKWEGFKGALIIELPRNKYTEFLNAIKKFDCIVKGNTITVLKTDADIITYKDKVITRNGTT